VKVSGKNLYARPPALRPGDRVALVAPASPFPRRLLKRGQAVLESLDLEAQVTRGEFRRLGFLAGGDAERARRLQQALEDERTRAVWCIRGGYGSARLLEDLRLEGLRPKLLIGCSDVTALLVFLARPGGWVTIHGPVVTQLGRLRPGARSWLRRLLFSPGYAGPVPLGRLRLLKGGRARGVLYGGNLSILASLAGTPWLKPPGRFILFVEEVNEPAYRLDRMWNQLRQAGFFAGVQGVLLGALAGCRPVCGAYSARRVLEKNIADLGVPAAGCSAFGHVDNNVSLPLGVETELDADRGRLTLLECPLA
jgi:muramoyltetrapeptide carboxypeptidase